MYELPEAVTAAQQINAVLTGRTVTRVTVNQSPHKFAFFHGDAEAYPTLLLGLTLDRAVSFGGMVELQLGQLRLVVNDGAILHYIAVNEKPPAKHQLELIFDNGSALYVTVQMYGGIMAFTEGSYANSYYLGSRAAISPLREEFDWNYFQQLIPAKKSLSAKAFLATEQRIPGLGNGVLQDILWQVAIHPKCKLQNLTEADLHRLYQSVKTTLKEMTERGGRDTERNIFGQPGGYRTKMSKNRLTQPCPLCGGVLRKEAYLGGSIYFCPNCQKACQK